jgi:sulfoacetaldehyde dehydrogenase
MERDINAYEYVKQLMERARAAQKIAEGFSQQEVDRLAAAIAWNIVQKDTVSRISSLAVEESKFGNFEGKYAKLTKKIRGVLRDIKDEKSVGIIEREEIRGITKIAKPVGVIGALVPCTNPEVTPVVKAMFAVKGRNAIIFSPHPRTRRTNQLVTNIMRETLKKYGAPEDLVITVEEPTLEISNEVMKQCDLIVATGGTPMVKAAYSSGTPAYGVGTGNAVVVVDETADISEAAEKIMLSKTFDYATSCSAENSVVIQRQVYDEMLLELKQQGGYLASGEEKQKLEQVMWINGHLNKDVIAQSAQKIAELTGISLPEGKTFIVVEETGIGKGYPFSGEKLSVVLAVYRYETFEEAIEKVNGITDYQGKGHSCGIHSNKPEHIQRLAMETRISRVMVNQPQCYANSGNWNNGMPFTMTLGCGTWGGNISSDNICLKHFLNVTWVSEPVEEKIPIDEDLFSDIMDFKSETEQGEKS